MEVLGNLDFTRGGVLIRPALATGDFPLNPKVGEFLFKDKRVFVCVEIENGLPFWVQLTQEINTFRLDVTNPSTEWVLNHNFNTNIVICQVYDTNGRQIMPDDINSSQLNRTVVTFNMPVAGVALAVVGDALGGPKQTIAFSASYSGTTWVVQHGLGFNPAITCVVNSYVVQPVSIVYNNEMQATVTFSEPVSGTVRCV